ncbi:MAG TPA: portal protein [Candidatus Syntrophosphaera sp.]|nr:portal protein [Candidatus Syntrophosphaera sp.]
MSAFMDFLNGLIGKTASGSRDKIAARIRKGEEPVKPEQTTAPREFDQFPAFYRMVGLEPPMVRGGYFGEVLDAWEMYRADDRVRSTIDSIADDATQINRNGLPFNILVKAADGAQNEKTKELQAALVARFKTLKIYQRSSDIIKFALLEGSRFYRIVVDFAHSEVVELRHIKGPKDGFITIELAEGQYRGYYVQFEYASQQPVAIFLPWEVVRFDWNRPDEAAYGMGLFSSARGNWKRLSKTEQDLYIARRTRAYARISREFPEASIEDLLRIRALDEEDRKKHGPMEVESDIYTTGRANVLDTSNVSIFNIEDVEHAQRRLFASGRRPVSLLGGYGRDAVNRAVLDRQEHRYISGFLSSVCEMFDSGMARLAALILLLQNVLPADYQISFEWTRKSVEDKQTLAQIAKDGVDRRALPLSIYASIFDLDPAGVNEEIESDLERLAEWDERFSAKFEDPGFMPPEE